MLFSIAKKYGSRREIKKINKIQAKASKKISNSYIDDSELRFVASQR